VVIRTLIAQVEVNGVGFALSLTERTNEYEGLSVLVSTMAVVRTPELEFKEKAPSELPDTMLKDKTLTGQKSASNACRVETEVPILVPSANARLSDAKDKTGANVLTSTMVMVITKSDFSVAAPGLDALTIKEIFEDTKHRLLANVMAPVLLSSEIILGTFAKLSAYFITALDPMSASVQFRLEAITKEVEVFRSNVTLRLLIKKTGALSLTSSTLT
jgi:hypothetical protein